MERIDCSSIAPTFYSSSRSSILSKSRSREVALRNEDLLCSFYENGGSQSMATDLSTIFDLSQSSSETEQKANIRSIPEQNLDMSDLSIPICAKLKELSSVQESRNSLKNILGTQVKFSCQFIKRKIVRKKKILHTRHWDDNVNVQRNEQTKEANQEKKKINSSSARVPKNKRKRRGIKCSNNSSVSNSFKGKGPVKSSRPESTEHRPHIHKNPSLFGVELAIVKKILEREESLDNLYSVLNTACSFQIIRKQVKSNIFLLRSTSLEVVKLALRWQNSNVENKGHVDRLLKLKAKSIKKTWDLTSQPFAHQSNHEADPTFNDQCKLTHSFTHIHSHVPIEFMWEGENYLLKMVNDFDFCEARLREICTVKEFANISTSERNPLFLPYNLDELYNIAVAGVSCPEGNLWKYFDKLSATESIQELYYAALVILLEEEYIEKRNAEEKRSLIPRNLTKEDLTATLMGKRKSTLSPLLMKKKISILLANRAKENTITEEQIYEYACKIQRFMRNTANERKLKKKESATRIQRYIRMKLNKWNQEAEIQKKYSVYENRTRNWIITAEICALKVQLFWRHAKAYHKYMKLLKTDRAIRIQAWARMISNKFAFKRYMSARMIQCSCRKWISGRKLLRLRHSRKEFEGAVGFQKLFRGTAGRKKYHDTKIYYSATKIESSWRRYFAIQEYHKILSARVVQNAWRILQSIRSVTRLRRRRNGCRKIQRWARYVWFQRQAQLDAALFDWRRDISPNHGLFRSQRICQQQLRILSKTLSAAKRLTHAYKFVEKVEDSDGLIQTLSVNKVKSCYTEMVTFTKHYTLDMIQNETDALRKRVLNMQRKMKLLYRVVELRIRVQISWNLTQSVFGNDEDNLRVSKEYILKKLHKIEDDLTIKNKQEAVARLFTNWGNRTFANQWEEKRMREAKKRRRQEAKSCGAALGRFIRTNSVKRVLNKRMQRNKDKILAKEMEYSWKCMEAEDHQSKAIRNFLVSPSDELERIYRLFRHFDKNKNGSIDAKEFQQMAYQFGCTLTFESAQEIINNYASSDNKAGMNAEDFAIWWLCDIDTHNSAIGSRVKVLALKLKLKVMCRMRYGKLGAEIKKDLKK